MHFIVIHGFMKDPQTGEIRIGVRYAAVVDTSRPDTVEELQRQVGLRGYGTRVEVCSADPYTLTEPLRFGSVSKQ